MKLKNINKLKNIKCIFLDIDNTLTNSKEFITEFCVAMKNSDSKLKEKAFCVTEFTNDEDGVAKFLEKYILYH